MNTTYCSSCEARVEVAEGRCWPSGHLVGFVVSRRCACGWRLDGARVCPACGTTTEQEAA